MAGGHEGQAQLFVALLYLARALALDQVCIGERRVAGRKTERVAKIPLCAARRIENRMSKTVEKLIEGGGRGEGT